MGSPVTGRRVFVAYIPGVFLGVRVTPLDLRPQSRLPSFGMPRRLRRRCRSSCPSGAQTEMWLVFHDEGLSLRHYLYTEREAQGFVLHGQSAFWREMRLDARGPEVMAPCDPRRLSARAAERHDQILFGVMGTVGSLSSLWSA